MMGSDFPYFQDEKYTRGVQYIKESGLDMEAVEGVLRGNAIQFYNFNH